MLESPRPISNQIKYMGCSYASKTIENIDLKKELNLSRISPNGMILVSFGSVTSGEHIPKKLIRTFLSVFKKLKQTVIWQFGSDPKLIGMRVPKNVHLHSWLPLQKLLGSKEIKLMVGHGGIRSLLEAVHQGVPVLGIPIQGCQPHDLKRVVDKGAAEIIEIPHLTEDLLMEKIEMLLKHNQRFRQHTRKLRSSILSYNDDLYRKKNIAEFWFRWAVDHGNELKNNGRFTRNLHVPFVQYYYIDLLCFVLFVLILVYNFAQKLTKSVTKEISLEQVLRNFIQQFYCFSKIIKLYCSKSYFYRWYCDYFYELCCKKSKTRNNVSYNAN